MCGCGPGVIDALKPALLLLSQLEELEYVLNLECQCRSPRITWCALSHDSSTQFCGERIRFCGNVCFEACHDKHDEASLSLVLPCLV